MAAATLGLLAAVSTLADWPPKRPVSLIVPYSAGGGTDAFAENLATRGSAPAVDDAAGARDALERMKTTVEPILARLE